MVEMSLEEFIEDVFKDNHEGLEKARELSELLDSLRDEDTQIYIVSVASDL